ncbi:epithelial-stromal interaction protein 1-like [Ptychodera flava]|uniref:epithelial-stromal interaction protein 1-like n=1 Tax=Ptychodera flava TaxID=63121 RepID=UPI003969C311
MSYSSSRTTRPVGSRTAGATNDRGRTTTTVGKPQRGRYTSPQRKPTTVPASTRSRSVRMDQPSDAVSGQNSRGNAGDPRQGQTAQERLQHRGNYAVIAPNEKKRSQIQRQAEKETRQYEEYKERNKMGYISLPPQTVGGGKVVSQTSARQQQSLQHRQVTARVGYGAKSSYKSSLRAKEEAEALEKKAKARMQTEKNKEREQTRQQRLDEDRRKKNDEFLRKFERNGKQPQGMATSSGHPQVTAVESFEPQSQTSHVVDRPGNSTSDPDVELLKDMFPHKTVDEISEALSSSSGAVDVAANVLMG